MRHNVEIMQRPFVIIALLLVLGFTACNRAQKAATPTRELSAAEYEVLTAWIDAKLKSKERVGKGLTKVVILILLIPTTIIS